MSRLFRKVVLFLVFLIAVLQVCCFEAIMVNIHTILLLSQIIHMSLMSRLETNKNERINKIATSARRLEEKYSAISYTDKDVSRERKQMYSTLQSLSSVLDSSGEYRIVTFISTSSLLKSSRWKYSVLSKIETLDDLTVGSNVYRKNDVSIVTHSTISQMHNLDLLSNRWNGLISFAVFATSIEQLPIAIEVILLLRFCRPAIRHKTSFHLVYPLNLSTKLNNHQARNILDFLRWPDIIDFYPEFKDFVSPSSCTRIEGSVRQLTEQSINYNHKVPYPNNLLRNIGRRYAMTEYTFVIDIDLVPSANLYESFLEFANRTKLFRDITASRESKVVFVVPTYEIDFNLTINWTKQFGLDIGEEQLIPVDKKQLLIGIEKRNIRPFYIELCWKCQKYTDYEAWMHASSLANFSSDNRIDILFEVRWHDPWEPFYISKNNVPFYDERFRQYGFNRISQVSSCFRFESNPSHFQVCELNIDGYKFAVLNNAFLIHKGFKTPNNFHPEKDLELERNRVLFRKFKLQLKDRYPYSSRKC